MLFGWLPTALARRILLGAGVVFVVLALVNAVVGRSTFGAVTSAVLALIAFCAAAVLTVVDRRRTP